MMYNQKRMHEYVCVYLAVRYGCGAAGLVGRDRGGVGGEVQLHDLADPGGGVGILGVILFQLVEQVREPQEQTVVTKVQTKVDDKQDQG